MNQHLSGVYMGINGNFRNRKHRYTEAVRFSKDFEKIQVSVRDPLCRKPYPWGKESREPASSEGEGGEGSTRFEALAISIEKWAVMSMGAFIRTCTLYPRP